MTTMNTERDVNTTDVNTRDTNSTDTNSTNTTTNLTNTNSTTPTNTENQSPYISTLKSTPPSAKPRIILTILVTLLAAASFYTLYTATSNYVEAAKATHRLGGQLQSLEVVGENTVLLTFHFNNTSSLDIVIQTIAVNVYANGKFLGNFDRRERIFLPPGEADITLTAEIHPFYMDNLTLEQTYSETILWFITGGVVVELPFEEMTITVSIEEFWVTEE